MTEPHVFSGGGTQPPELKPLLFAAQREVYHVDRDTDRNGVIAAFAAGKRVGFAPDGSEAECPYPEGILRDAWLDGLMMGRIEAHFWRIRGRGEEK
jgi:ribosome modulation factor